MNLILLTEEELHMGLAADDPRAKHIRGVLRKSADESFDVGLINGPRGKARIVPSTDERVRLTVELLEVPPPPYPLVLYVGLCRPQTVRRILRDCTAMGVGGFIFFGTDRSEAGYAESRLWDSGEVERLLIDGAQQGFSTHLPFVERREKLADCLSRGPELTELSFALDNYEATESLGEALRSRTDEARFAASRQEPAAPGAALFVGAERGWSERERLELRDGGVPLVHLGQRVLRTDVACITGASVLLSSLGFYERGWSSNSREVPRRRE